jgi:hypothetical protein
MTAERISGEPEQLYEVLGNARTVQYLIALDTRFDLQRGLPSKGQLGERVPN